MTLVHAAEDTPLSPTSHREVNTILQTHVQLIPPQQGTSYSCPECKQICPSMDNFKKHMQTAHAKSQNAACKLCDKVYKTVKSLRRHEKTHPEIQAKSDELPCRYCPKKFSTQTALHWHEVRNHIDTVKTNTCHVCMKEFVDHANLKRHLEMAHSLETATCSVCNKVFKSLTNLQRHINVTHAPDESVQTCDICNKTFKCSMHLRIHIRTVHTAETVFSCDICSKEFPSKKYMLKHKKIHVDVKEFPCSVCGKLFKSTDDVRKHTKRVHMKTEAPVKRTLKSVVCDICDKTFNHRKYMLLHRKTHTDIKPFSCEYCDKTFKSTNHVRKHIKGLHFKCLTETGCLDAKYTCDICKKEFTMKKNMAKHIKIHYGVKDTPCGICDKLFKSNSDVNKHLKRVHMKGLIKRDKEATNTPNTTITSAQYTDALQNLEYTENIISSTKYAIKALEITEYTDEVPRSEDYRLETLGGPEYTVGSLENMEYTLEVLASSHTEVNESTDFMHEPIISANHINEVSEGAELTALGNTDLLNDDDVLQSAIKGTEISMDVLRIACEAVDITKSKEETATSEVSADIDIGRTIVLGEAIRSNDILKDALEISEFTMEDLGITEEAVNSIKTEETTAERAGFAVKALGCKVVAEDTPRNNNILQDAIKFADFTMEDLGITEEEVLSSKSKTEASESTIVVHDNLDSEKKEDSVDKSVEFIKRNVKNTDIIREALEISDFTMEDLGIKEYTVNAPDCANVDETIEHTETIGSPQSKERNTGLIETFGCTEGINLIAENTEFTDKAHSNTDIIKEALNISDFAIDDLDITEKGVKFEKPLENIKNIITDGPLICSDFMEALKSPACEKKAETENLPVLECTEYREKTLDNTDDISDSIVNSDFTIDNIGFPEYPDIDDLGIEECPEEVLTNTGFIDETLVNNNYVEKGTEDIEFTEALGSTELTDTISSKYFIEDALGNAEYAKSDSGTDFTDKISTDFLEEAFKGTDFNIENADFIEEELDTTAFTEEIAESTDFIENMADTESPKDLHATEFIEEALGNTENIKERIDDSDFTMEDLKDYAEGALNTEYSIEDLEMPECTDTVPNIDLLNCLKCGIDFKNDVDLHTHLCGGEITLFLDFQDM